MLLTKCNRIEIKWDIQGQFQTLCIANLLSYLDFDARILNFFFRCNKKLLLLDFELCIMFNTHP